MNEKIGRRAFLQGVGLAGVSTAVGLAGQAQVSVPNSSGTQSPGLKAPAFSCDCHLHIYDIGRFPTAQPGAISNARVAEYRLLQRRIGTTRNVIVTPRPYGIDNRVTIDAIAQFGINARGVAVVHPEITDVELKRLDAGGIRGIRFSIGGSSTTPDVTTVGMIEPLAKRVNALGWHVQINMDAEQIAAAGDLWNRVASAIVFDHMGVQSALLDGTKHPAFTIIRRLIDKGRTWVKLSVGTSAAVYGSTKERTHMYDDLNKVGQAYVQAAPERLVWGSNWPHPNETAKPDDAMLFDLLTQWAPREGIRHRILVENPESLYGFAKSR